jgi:hypothetical protein
MDDDGAGLPGLPNQNFGRRPAQRHAFLFGHNLGSPDTDIDELRPLPSEIPFLLDTFGRNVNLVLQVVHMPTIREMVQDMTTEPATSPPANEALLFAISYAAIISMEEEDVSLPLTLFHSDRS